MIRLQAEFNEDKDEVKVTKLSGLKEPLWSNID